MDKRPEIYLFTDRYPYGSGEAFVGDELQSPALNDIRLTVIPARTAPGRRELPPDVRLCDLLCHAPVRRKIRALFSALFSATLWSLPFRARRPRNFRQWRNALGGTYRIRLTRLTLRRHAAFFARADVFYSYWLDNTATGLCLAKKTIPALARTPIVSRAHGYDVFEQTRGIFFPERPFALEHLTQVWSVSLTGQRHLQRTYPAYAEKISLAYLGTADPPAAAPHRLPDGALRFASCANLIPLKRIGTILAYLKRYAAEHPDTTISWTHFGSGPLWGTLKKETESPLPENLAVTLAGQTPHPDILRRYREDPFDIFLSLSQSEGMPVSVVEAMACGIVPLCTDAGGTGEAVTPQTGVLLPLDPAYEDFAQGIDRIRTYFPELSSAAIAYRQATFSGRTNYSAFYHYLRSLKA